MDILETCDGLPLAIKVVGECLRGCRTRGDWRGVYNNLAWSMAASKEISDAIYESYVELPSHLKQCLLYCSLFPKDELIPKGVIVRLWIAEGLIQITSSVSLEELGYQYYEELVSRNLLEPDYNSYEMSACTMNNAVRSFCRSLSKYDGLLLQEGHVQCITPSAVKLRHLSISKTAVVWGDLEEHVSLRTLMVFRSITIESKYLCSNFICLRVLTLKGANLVELSEAICKIKHLRYLGLVDTSISTIPQGIEALKFLQFIELTRNTKLSEISNSILKLQKLRFISFSATKLTSIPIGFRKIEGLVEILGFPTLLDDSTDVWCSLEELGPLSRLRILDIESLEKASSGSMAARAKLSSKPHLTKLGLAFTSRFAHDGVLEVDISSEEQEQVEEVLDNLCPPTCIELLTIDGYFGHRLPQWMRTMTIFESLRRLHLSEYACCELPNGLDQLLFLDYFWVDNAPFIDRIGHDLVLHSLGGDGMGMDKAPASAETEIVDRRQQHQFSHGAAVAFSKLKTLRLQRMLRWRVWEWGQQARAMPALEELSIHNCKLTHLPCGLARHAGALRKLDLRNVPHLVCIENFPSLSELMLVENPSLERINNNSSLRHIYIHDCPALMVLEDLPALQSIEWRCRNLEALPEYLRVAKLNKLIVHCCISLLKLISLQDAKSDSEWRKIQHVQHVKAYGYISEEENRHIFYTKEPYSFKTNIGETWLRFA
jgi:Leucine-rich repeat (LRR) protein